MKKHFSENQYNTLRYNSVIQYFYEEHYPLNFLGSSANLDVAQHEENYKKNFSRFATISSLEPFNKSWAFVLGLDTGDDKL